MMLFGWSFVSFHWASLAWRTATHRDTGKKLNGTLKWYFTPVSAVKQKETRSFYIPYLWPPCRTHLSSYIYFPTAFCCKRNRLKPLPPWNMAQCSCRTSAGDFGLVKQKNTPKKRLRSRSNRSPLGTVQRWHCGWKKWKMKKAFIYICIYI